MKFNFQSVSDLTIILVHTTLLFLFIMLFSACSLRHKPPDPLPGIPKYAPDNVPQSRIQEGIQAAAKGDLPQAIVLFNGAATEFKENGNLSGQCECYVRAAHACLALGHADKATAYLEVAEQAAMTIDSQTLTARCYALKGNLCHMTGKPVEAETCMVKAIAIAEKQDSPALLISVHNDLGNLYGALQHYSKALESYRKSASLAKTHGKSLRSAIALTNGAMVCITDGDGYKSSSEKRYAPSLFMNNVSTADKKKTRTRGSILFRKKQDKETIAAKDQKASELFAEAASLLKEASSTLQSIQNSPDKVIALINTGLAYLKLSERIPEQAAVNCTSADRAFSEAVQSAREFDNKRLVSYAIGNRGRLRHKDGKLDLAAEMTQSAIFWARQADAPESLYRWEWEYAGILVDQNRIQEAIPVYQNAITTLASIRSELSNCYGQPRAELHQSAGNLYLEYVDILLRYANVLEPTDQQDILKAARETIEMRKVFELREYFKDDCLGASVMASANVDELLVKAVIIYPIILPDRLAIIATFPTGTYPNDVSTPADRDAVIIKQYVTVVDSETLNQEVDDFRDMLEKKLPMQDLTHSKKLYDRLIRPLEQDLARTRPNTLVFVPDGPFRNIPMDALYDGSSYLIQSYAVGITPGLALTNPTPLNPEKINVLAAGITKASQGFVALPGVKDELQVIASLYNTKLLMDDRFSRSEFEQALQNGQYNVVHIASHGEFGEHIEESFILTSDHRLTFNDLSTYIGLYRFRDQPLELLALSACATAEGNDQAALGLAGIAVKVGARSSLATLWAVDDQAAAKLVSEFYRQLTLSGASRAIALQKAKQKLLNNPVFSHPGYWAPFVLINNWL